MLRKRQRAIHARIIEQLPEIEPYTLIVHPEIAARHLEAAGRVQDAIKCWHQAGSQAMDRSALREAIEFFECAVKLLRARPRSDANLRLELSTQIELGHLYGAVWGDLSAGRQRAYELALALCRELNDCAPERLYAYLGLWDVWFRMGQLDDAWDVATEMVAGARATGDSKLLACGHYTLANTTFWLGDYARCREHIEGILDSADTYWSDAVSSRVRWRPTNRR